MSVVAALPPLVIEALHKSITPRDEDGKDKDEDREETKMGDDEEENRTMLPRMKRIKMMTMRINARIFHHF